MNAMKKMLLLSFFVLSTLSPVYASGQFFFFENSLEGKPAPDFTLKTLDGKELNLTKFREGHAAIVFFWATWCPHCGEQFRELGKLTDELERKGIKLILVNLDEDVRSIPRYVQQYNIKHEVALDTDSAVADKYGIVGVPTFYFVDKSGVIKLMEHELPENYGEILGEGADKSNQPPSEKGKT